MTQATKPIGDDDLHAYADGRLDATRQASVEAWLAEHPDEASRVAFYRRLNSALHERFDSVLAEPVPAAMTQKPVLPQRRTWLRSAGLAAACLVAGLFGGWFARDAIAPIVPMRPGGAPAIAHEASLAHLIYTAEVRHPVEVRAGEEHLLRWLSNRMGKPIKAPNLPDGFRLMGGRLLPAVEGGIACQLMYEDVNGRRITIYYAKRPRGTSGETAFRYVEERDGLGVFYWIDEALGYAISGRLPRDTLLQMAHAVYEQLER
jgi:anti-sigma factor RsiW